jgi:hypothetical protein
VILNKNLSPAPRLPLLLSKTEALQLQSERAVDGELSDNAFGFT